MSRSVLSPPMRSTTTARTWLRFEMPITDEVEQILFRGKSPRDAVTDLMLRVPKDEGWS